MLTDLVKVTHQVRHVQLDALVKQITASFVGAQSCIPEPGSPATSRSTHGTPLTTPAQVPVITLIHKSSLLAAGSFNKPCHCCHYDPIKSAPGH